MHLRNLALAASVFANLTHSAVGRPSLSRAAFSRQASAVVAFTFASATTGSRSKRGPFCAMSSTAAPPASAEEVESKKLEDISPSYSELLKRLRSITNLKRSQAVLKYDQMVSMPHSARTSAERGAQLAALAGVIHEKATDKSIKELASKAEDDLKLLSAADTTVNKDAKRILELTKIRFEKNERIPPELEAKRAELSASAHTAWVKARQSNDFASFEPFLRDCFETAKEVARAQRGDDKSIPLYTQMLDEFEMGMPSERIDEIFGRIKEALVPLIDRVLKSSTQPSTDALHGKFPIPVQEALSKKIVTSLGFDNDHGRIDVSVHPFTTSFSPADVRITSRFSEKEWYQGLAGTIHEGGHAMYEQNLPNSGLEVDTYLSMGTHESQSLFWERHVGLSKSFWRWAAPLLCEAFGGPEEFPYNPEELYGAVNHVAPGLIRVEADELTYPLHVILRYNIERDVVEGRMDIKDIPSRWKEEMKNFLNVDVPDDTRGCLQDVHWSALAIGYFPTYLLGSATAAQLAYFCKKDIPDMYEKIERGEFSEIKEWLTSKVHQHGKRYKSLDDLLQAQVGEKLNPQYFIDYLTEKYAELYQC